MSLDLFVAVRYLRSKRKGLFRLLTTAIGVAGVCVGVAALITTLSVMNGFRSDIERKVIGAQAHLTVYGDLEPAGKGRLEELLARAGARAWAPFAAGQAILSCRGRSTGVVLKGIDPEREFRVNDLASSLSAGGWGPLRGARKTNEPPAIVLGVELAAQLGVAVGADVVLLSPQGADTPFGLVPKMARFRVAGLLRTGYYEYDSASAWAGLEETARFLGLKSGASGVGVRLRRLEDAERAARALQRELGFAWTVRSFRDMNRTLFAALRLEKYVMFLILALIVLVASFNIASTLILMGTEKLRDIGMLRAMGAAPAQIRRIFLWEGLMMGGLGTGLGTALGLALCWIIRRYPLVELPPDIYYLSRVPVRVDPWDLLVVAVSGLALSALATLYPAGRAARANPVEALHYG